MALNQPAAGDELFDYPWEQFDRVHFSLTAYMPCINDPSSATTSKTRLMVRLLYIFPVTNDKKFTANPDRRQHSTLQ